MADVFLLFDCRKAQESANLYREGGGDIHNYEDIQALKYKLCLVYQIFTNLMAFLETICARREEK